MRSDVLQQLANRWRDACSVMNILRRREAGCADNCAILPLPESMQPQAGAVCADPVLNRRHDLVPVALGLVEADGLMTARIALSDDRVQAVSAVFAGRPSDAALVECCWPLPGDRAAPEPPGSGGSFTAIWQGDAFEVVERALLSDELARSGERSHDLAAGLLIGIGVAPPVMHAVRFNGRCLLTEGHHRARALRALGVGYLPCVVSACQDLDELELCAPRAVFEDWQRYFESPRPPMLADFSRPELSFLFDSRKFRRRISLQVRIDEEWSADES